jgi:membrane-bound metal-dependent hydrolase YbcI (DUF457 family)
MYWYMLFLGHLVIGLIIGFILYEFFHDRTIIVFVAIGSVLPDVIDKPLGHIIFGSTLDNGKIFFHSFIIVLLFFITGLIVWKLYKSPSFIFVASGMFLHQLVDMMWTRPVNWYYPFFGPYQTEAHTDYFLNAIVAELTSVTEWIFFVAILAIAYLLYRNTKQQKQIVDPDPLIREKTRRFYGSLLAVALFVLALSVIIIYLWDPFFNY